MRSPYTRVYWCAFLFDFAMVFGYTTVPFYCYGPLGGGAGMSGLIFAASFGAYAVASLLSSRFVGQTRNGLRWAVAGGIVFTLFYSLAPVYPSPLMFGAGVSLAMCGLPLVWAALQSWLGAEPDPVVRSRRISLFTLSWSAAIAIGPVLAGPLADTDLRLPFVAMFFAGAAALLIIRSIPGEHDLHPPQTDEQHAERVRHAGRGEALLHAAWAANIIGCALVLAARSVYPRQLLDILEAGALTVLPGVPWTFDVGKVTLFGCLAFFLSASRTLVFFFMGRFAWWQNRLSALIWAQFAAAAAMWFLANTSSLVVMAVAFTVLGANNGVTFFASIYYSLADPALKHRRAAINEGLVGIGNGGGPLLAGLVAGSLGAAAPFLWGPAFVALGLVLQVALMMRTRRRLNAPGKP